ncbi:MAG TPA: cytochrome c oxidase assembly protein [Sphingomonas sp.]|nr:cytochrome c oxidase assembly protein [Sphingomonas sp.]
MTVLARDPKQRTALMLALVALGMVGLGFASVPLYRLFCQVTGLNGTTQRGLRAPGAISGRTMTIRFDANRAPNLPWSFKPEEPTQGVTIGEREQAIFVATNNASKPVTGTATFNVTPVQAGKYFTKIQCFCFTQQTLKPGESVRMPVIYFVDPKILNDPDARDIEEITLSYTFYPVADQPKAG